MEFTLEFFANDKYEILKILYENQIKVKDDFYVSLSQQEIADIAHFSKPKTNKIINELINNKCIIPYQNKRGKYALTDRGYSVIRQMQNNNI